MNIAKYPSAKETEALLKRPATNFQQLFGIVQDVLNQVQTRGDAALREYEARFDGVQLQDLAVTEQEIAEATSQVDEQLRTALHQAYENIYKFHHAQKFTPITVETAPGVVCQQKSVPIERVGLYIPGGTAPLFSTVLMLAIPAQIAGCREVVLCTPPDKQGKVNPVILYAAQMCGVTQIFKVGGSQAIAAMTFGTESIPKVWKIFGPGNQFVMAAKQLATLYGVAIDMPAGPSEVAVIADEKANPAFVAADLLSQAEHGKDSQVVLITHSEDMLKKVSKEVDEQLKELPRQEMASIALEHSVGILTHDLTESIQISNQYAPEHLILAVENYKEVALQITQAGSVFEGKWSCESAGDYASGTNHTLPTKGYAQSFGGLCLDSFCKKVTFQELTAEGIRQIGRSVIEMANREGLDAHKKAMEIRVNSLK